ncbi:MAG: HlyD family efflux transporter periplasmic adaptor subunit [Planctomycetaceae bacterium]|jgi:membrane fusion protein, multidrug efflux system|nr:HlyD family efflux transporter periplasmic adaptor subunit [Planctomycetaceae bacterium]MBT6158245.1 HlyD family efflux transporter periplasmic adaptor subunit [Planctomycetaceae bacterium]MBT6487573.1 HlyD family efflux transporter periplasmic adaptor subunit [Planctomycetaceae bacterium]MBT6493231.1 HlyD family efflux transporter periplasmic adaptor subunit [Planctomycetaceae bacterium]
MNRRVVGFTILCCCLVCLLLEMTSHGDTQETERHSRRRPDSARQDAFVVSNCRIKLINDVQLASERPGILSYVAAEGTAVRNGELVVQIRDNVARASYDVAEKLATNDVEVRFASKATELAQLKFLRALEANEQSAGTVPDLELRELRLLADKSLLQLEQAKQQFLLAGLKRNETREQLRTYRVQTPFDAVVLNVYKQVGEVVREGDPILEVASTAWVRVTGYLPVEYAHQVAKGSLVTVRTQLPHVDKKTGELHFSGEVGFVGTKVEPLTKKVRIWAIVANRNGLLRDGMTASIHVLPRSSARQSTGDNAE